MTVENWNLAALLATGLVVGLVSIAALGQTMYHVRLSQDYYDPAKSGERPGEFVGKGAELLGLRGRVTSAAFRSLMRGFHPLTGKPLVQNAGKDNRDTAWDVVFSPPKSFSVLWGLADDATRQQFENAFRWALDRSIERLATATYCRKGKDDQLVRAEPVVSSFFHSCSRPPALDPQPHWHCVVHNISVTAEGTPGAILSKGYYRWAAAWGALFRCDLWYALQQRFPSPGCRTTKTAVEIAGVPDHVLRHFSSRRRQIEEELAGLESETAAAKAFACLKSRDPKKSVPPLTELSVRWRDEARRLGFDPEIIPQLLSHGQRREVDKEKVLGSAFATAVDSLTEKQSHFSELDLIRFTADAATGKGVCGADVKQFVEGEIKNSQIIQPVGRLRGQQRFSTPAIIKEEEILLGRAEQLSERPSKPVTSVGLTARVSLDSLGTLRRWFALDHDPSLSADQRQAIKFLTQQSGQLAVLTTAAGTPKMETLRRAADFHEAAGHQVLGIGPTANHARRLADEAHIPSVSLALFLALAERDHSLIEGIKHAAKQLVREAIGRRIGLYPYERQPLLDAKSVVLVDRCEQISTQDMASLLKHCERYGAKVILAGNADRIQSLKRGAPFGAFAKRLPRVELTTVERPREKLDIETAERIRRGEAKEVIQDLTARGRLHVAETKQAAIEKLLADWHAQGGSRNPADHLIIVNTPTEARRVNLLASECCRGREPAAKPKSIILPSGEKIFVGDRLLCTQTSRRYGVESGSLGTVKGVSRRLDLVQLELDTGKTVTLPLATYPHLARGFAVTTWHAPTAAHVYLLLGGSYEDRQAALVKFTRASQTTRAYVDRANAGPEMHELARQLAMDREKTLASEVARTATQSRQQHHRER